MSDMVSGYKSATVLGYQTGADGLSRPMIAVGATPLGTIEFMCPFCEAQGHTGQMHRGNTNGGGGITPTQCMKPWASEVANGYILVVS